MADALDLGSSGESCESSSLSSRTKLRSQINQVYEETMQFSVENVSELERRASVTVPADKVEAAIVAKLHKINPQLKLPGFRPGKVPFPVLQKRYGTAVRAEVLEDTIHATFTEILQKENLRLAGNPKFELGNDKPGEPLTYTVTFETFPPIQLKNFAEIQIEKPIAEVADKDIDEAIEKLLHEHVLWKEVTDQAHAAVRGDQVVVDFTVRIRSDRPPETKVEKNVDVVLGNGKMWTDFEDHLYNCHAGDELNFMLTFPDTHYDRELAGHNADFNVKVLKHSEPIYPPVDDDLAKKVGIKNGGLEALRNEIKASLGRELNHALKNLTKKSLMDALVHTHPITLPKSMVQEEIKRMQENFRQRLGAMQSTAPGAAKELPELPEDKCRPTAERHVALGLLLSTIVRERGLKVDPSELRTKVEEMAAMYDESAKIVNWYYSNREHLIEVESLLLEEKALAEIEKHAHLAEKPLSYTDAVKMSRGME